MIDTVHSHQRLTRHDGHKVPDQGYFKRNNNIVKYGYWTLIGLILVGWTAHRLLVWRQRRKTRSADVASIYQSPDGKAQIIVESPTPEHSRVTTTRQYAVSRARAMTYPRWIFTGKFLRHMNPPSQGEALFLAGYLTLLMALLWTNVIFKSPVEVFSIRWEVVGFRASWVGTMQFPLLYATGCKYNIISLVTGISHDRLNWFHRWIARFIFVVLIVHWAFFFQEWVLAGFVKKQFETMPMVTWGFIAWGASGLMVVSGFGWFRARAFEVWLVSHIVLAWAVLALSYKHTGCTTYFVGASVACLLFDLGARAVLGFLRNVQLPGVAQGAMGFGHKIHAEVLDEQYLRLVVKSPKFSWAAGNHVYLTLPSIRMFESHPFTIANASARGEHEDVQRLVLIVKRHDGFTKELYDRAASPSNNPIRGFVRGPHGSAPYLKDQNTAIFISMGNRASYCTALLQELVRAPGTIHNVVYHLIVPHLDMYDWYKELLQSCEDRCKAAGIKLAIIVHVTRGEGRIGALTDKSEITADHFAIGRSSTDSDWSDEEAQAMIDEKSTSKSTAMRISSDKAASPTTDDDSDETQLLQKKEGVDETMFGTGTQILEGRPSAKSLLEETVRRSQAYEKIMVVAAVSPVVAASLSYEVCGLISSSRREGHSSNLRLWVEQNG